MRSAVILAALLLTLTTANVMAVEEAKYAVIQQQDDLEVREYTASIIAEVVVNGDFEDASGKAFRTLFNYISVGNVFMVRFHGFVNQPGKWVKPLQ